MSGTTPPTLASIQAQLQAMDTRLRALEITSPSPDGTIVSNTMDGIRYDSGTVFKITINRQIARTPLNGVSVTDVSTSNVIAIAKLNATTLVQKNNVRNYYTRPETEPDGQWTQIAPEDAGPLKPAVYSFVL